MIGFESEEISLQKLRDRLRLMSDDELVRFGRTLRGLCANKRVSLIGENPFIRQLAEARAEWRQRHPRR